MAIIRFKTIANNQSISFNPATDILQFDDLRISAGSLVFNYSALYDNISFTARGKTFFLPTGVLATSLTTSNVTFADGSQLLVGDASNNSVLGTNFGDYLDGLAGADTMTGGFGSDTYVVDNVGDVVVEMADATPLGNDAITLISGALDGENANGLSYSSSISSDGRYVLLTTPSHAADCKRVRPTS